MSDRDLTHTSETDSLAHATSREMAVVVAVLLVSGSPLDKARRPVSAACRARLLGLIFDVRVQVTDIA